MLKFFLKNSGAVLFFGVLIVTFFVTNTIAKTTYSQKFVKPETGLELEFLEGPKMSILVSEEAIHLTWEQLDDYWQSQILQNTKVSSIDFAFIEDRTTNEHKISLKNFGGLLLFLMKNGCLTTSSTAIFQGNSLYLEEDDYHGFDPIKGKDNHLTHCLVKQKGMLWDDTLFTITLSNKHLVSILSQDGQSLHLKKIHSPTLQTFEKLRQTRKFELQTLDFREEAIYARYQVNQSETQLRVTYRNNLEKQRIELSVETINQKWLPRSINETNYIKRTNYYGIPSPTLPLDLRLQRMFMYSTPQSEKNWDSMSLIAYKKENTLLKSVFVQFEKDNIQGKSYYWTDLILDTVSFWLLIPQLNDLREETFTYSFLYSEGVVSLTVKKINKIKEPSPTFQVWEANIGSKEDPDGINLYSFEVGIDNSFLYKFHDRQYNTTFTLIDIYNQTIENSRLWEKNFLQNNHIIKLFSQNEI